MHVPNTSMTVKQVFENSLMAWAAYADLRNAVDDQYAMLSALEDWPLPLATYFVENYAVLWHTQHAVTGYSASLFARRVADGDVHTDFFLAQRGTDFNPSGFAQDVVADVGIAVLGFAGPQTLQAVDALQDLLNGADGVLSPELAAELRVYGAIVSGHSLGGHLAGRIAGEFPEYIHAGATYQSASNASMVPGGPGRAIERWTYNLEKFAENVELFKRLMDAGVLEAHGDIGNFSNFINDSGVDVVAGGDFFGTVDRIFAEEEAPWAMHAIVKSGASLTAYYALSLLESDQQRAPNLDDLRQIISAASATGTTTLEAVARTIARYFGDSENVGVDGATYFMDIIRERESNPEPQLSLWNLSAMSAAEIASVAMEDSAAGRSMRLALLNNHSFSLAGDGIDLTGDPHLELENFNAEELQARAEYLSHFLRASDGNKDFLLYGMPEVLNSGRAVAYYAENLSRGEAERRVASDPDAAEDGLDPAQTAVTRVTFGTQVADEIDGDQGNDRIFGGFAADTLYGGGGADELDGGQGDDLLNGEAGNDTLRGGIGDDGLVGGEGVNNLFGGAGDDTYVVAVGSGNTIRDVQGTNEIIISSQSGDYVLGSGEIRALSEGSIRYKDDRENTYEFTNGELTVALADGGTIRILDFSANNYGLELPVYGAPPIDPNSSQPVFFSSFSEGAGAERQAHDTGASWDFSLYGSYYTDYLGWHSPAAFFASWAPENINIPLFASSLDDYNVYWGGEWSPYTLIQGGPGVTVINGSANSNFIVDDATYFQHPDGIWGFYAMVRGEQMGNDLIYAGAGNDYVMTHAGDDIVFGGDGDDLIDAGTPAFEAVHGSDFLYYYDRGDPGWLAADPARTNNDELFGEGGADVIVGAAGNQMIDGGTGDDYLFGGAHNDRLFGGDGNDVLAGDVYQSENEFIRLEDDSNQYGHWLSVVWQDNLRSHVTYHGDDYLSGGDGNDVLIGGGGDDQLLGGAGDDRLLGDFDVDELATWWSELRFQSLSRGSDPDSIAGDDVIYGYAGADEILGGGGADHLDGGADNDTVKGGAGNDYITGGTGNDILYGDYTQDDQGVDTILGGDGNDTIYGFAGNDTLEGGDGDDVIVGGGGGEVAGSGNDRIDGGRGDDTIYGEDGADKLFGGAGSDTLYGGPGDDVLAPGSGGGYSLGGAGDDTLFLSQGDGSQVFLDDSGTNRVRFDSGIGRDDVRLARSSGGNTILHFGMGDSISLSGGTLAAISGVEFANGDVMTRAEMLARYDTGVANLSVNGNVEVNVALNEISLHGVNDDLIVHYTGALPEWVVTESLDARRIAHSIRPASEFGLAVGEVLILHNWFAAEYGTYVSAIVQLGSASGESINLYGSSATDLAAAWNIGRSLTATHPDDPLIGAGGSDTLVGSAGDDLMVGAGGNDVFTPNAGNDLVFGNAGDDEFRISASNGFDIVVDDNGTDTIRFTGSIRSTDVEFSEGLNDLMVQLGAEEDLNVVGVAGWFESPQHRIENWIFEGDGITLTSAEVEARIIGNRRPVFDVLPATEIAAGEEFSFSFPAGSIVDPNGDAFTVSARLADGSPLPDWLQFSDSTLTFSGLAPSTGTIDMQVRIFATDDQGSMVHGTFALTGIYILNGTPGDDYLLGSPSVDDVVDALAGYDTIYGYGGNDELNGGDDADYIDGGDGNDTLTAGGNPGFTGINDRLVGGAGNDTFVVGNGGEQAQILPGSAGGDIDTLQFEGVLPSAIRVSHDPAGNLTLQFRGSNWPISGVMSHVIMSSAIDANGDAVAIDRVTFSTSPGLAWTMNDLRAMALAGTSGNDHLVGFDTDDVIAGGAGADVVYGQAGNDDITGGAGNDNLNGGSGNDTYRFGATDGFDQIFESTGANRVVLAPGITPANVTLHRHHGRTSASEVMTNDALMIVFNNGVNQIRVGGYYFNDTPQSLLSQIVFADGTVWDEAEINARIVDSGAVGNAATGTTGNDTYTVDHRGDIVTENVGEGADQINSSVSYTLGANVENLTLTGIYHNYAYGNDLANLLQGNAAGNHLRGGDGNDTLLGGGGDDLLEGENGADVLQGGAGDDVYVLFRSWGADILAPHEDSVLELAGEGYDTLRLNAYNITLPDNFERLELDSELNPSGNRPQRLIAGNALDNHIDARFEAKSGSNGLITIDGGLGADVMIGSRYSNLYIVDNAGDQIIEVRSLLPGLTDSGMDFVHSTVSYTLPDFVEELKLMGSAALNGTGNAGDNLLDGTSSSAANILTGLSGNDTYHLGAGDVAVEGANGGFDTLVFTFAGSGTPVVYNFADFANIEGLDFSSTGQTLIVNGTAGNEFLRTTYGNDIIDMGGGDDVIFDNGGSDLYRGFSTTSGHDVIEESSGEAIDVVEFSAAGNLRPSDVVFSRADDDLILTTAASSSIRLAYQFSDPAYGVDQFVFQVDGSEYRISRAQAEAAASGNSAPAAVLPLADTQATVGQAFNYQFASNVFTDIESQASLTYAATLDTGAALPAWLTFNASTRTFSGTPVGGNVQLNVRVTATDAGSLTGFDDFIIDVQGGAIVGTSGNDNLVGTNNNDIIQALAGTDTLNGGLGADQMFGGPGNDTYIVDNTGDTTVELAGEGTDNVQSSVSFTLAANVENLTLTGSSPINGTGNELVNNLTGNSGANTLDGGAGNDVMAGGGGNDVYIVDGADQITEASGGGTDTIMASVSVTTLAANVEHITLTGTASINATGSSGNNTLTGNSGNNLLTGNGGTDTMVGGAGDDTYVVDGTTDVVTEAPGEGTDTIQTSVTLTSWAANVENMTLLGTSNLSSPTGNSLDNVITGNSGTNTLSGGDGNDSLYGLGGADTLNGGNGNDLLDGGAGNDPMTGGAGDDVYVVDSASDSVTEAVGGGTDTIQTSVLLSTWASNVENMTLLGTSNLNAPTGNSLNNVITGNSATNSLNGGDGNDTLYGMGGSDTLTGGIGNDLLDGGASNDAMTGGTGDDTYVVDHMSDTVTEAASGGTDTVQATVTRANWFSETENYTLIGTDNINAPTGTNGANVIIGNSGNNLINGNGGNDTLRGNGGTDSLTGGLGADIYQYSAGDGTDTIDNAAADALIDRLQFTDIASTQMAFTKSGNHLVITRTGFSDVITVSNWFSATGNRIDFLNFTNREVTAAEVDALFAGGGSGGTLSFSRAPAAQRDLTDFAGRVQRSIEFDTAAQELASAGFGDFTLPESSDAPQTLAEKGAREHWTPIKPTLDTKQRERWTPIKPMLTATQEAGFESLVSAMASFGKDGGVDALASIDRDAAVDTLAAAAVEVHTNRTHEKLPFASQSWM
jgi:trimeric autotransporter adhesin